MRGGRFQRPRWTRSGAAAAIALVAAACSRPSAPPAPPPAPAVEAVTLEAPGQGGELSATGPLERRREMTLSFRIPGVITRLAVEAGDPVRQGQVLAALDPASVAAAEQSARVQADQARRDLERDKALFDKGFVSRQRLDDRQSALEAAEAALKSAAFDRRWATLISPVDGVVLSRTAQSGEVVQPSQAVLKVADLKSPLILRAPLADRDVARVRPGQSAAVTLESVPGQTFQGQVTRVGQRAGAQTGAVDVEIEIADPGPLRSGQMAAARITADAPAGDAAQFSRAPAEAILEASASKAFVYVVGPDSVVHRRQVVFGGFDGDDARVGGLAPGSRVVTAGAGFVSDGDRVRVIDPARLPPAGAPAR